MSDEVVCADQSFRDTQEESLTYFNKCTSDTDQICLSRSQITKQWSQPCLSLSLCSVLSASRLWQQRELILALNEGLRGSGWLKGKRKGSARECCQRKVQICFSRQSRFWLQASILPPWFIFDVYQTGLWLAKTELEQSDWKPNVYLCSDYLQQTYANKVRCTVQRNTCAQTDILEKKKHNH